MKEGREPHGWTARRVVEAFRADPTLTSTEYGKRLGLHPAYVRATLRRNGFRLVRSRKRD